ncbi:CRTAC1 family protein [Parvularcula sp. ZS-1/3]|uniref:CRTAC1 family protein n=1 Tax=Parvularcula mediterranea TaxID=2732508 RepID=A0A7Y3W461_9PROT|nr:CRTAC1 family protein [Parvularcula mediterranea]NNU15143.1 CRTAC1 family protein [Parvularcula mediterranea]
MGAMSPVRAAGLAALILSACSGGGGDNVGPAPSGGSSGGGTPPTTTSQPPSKEAVPTSFREQAAVRGMTHNYRYSGDINPMVRQFAGGAASGDVDGDGDPDVVMVGGGDFPLRLYINNRTSFTDEASTRGLVTGSERHSGPVLGDLDGDGDLDLFLGGLQGDSSRVFLNDGSGRFSDATAGSGLDRMTSLHTVSAAFGDYDLDGDLDIAMAHWGTERQASNPGETETLWRNDSSGGTLRFVPVSGVAGISAGLELSASTGVMGVDIDYSFAPSLVDINGDRYPDLLLVADFDTSQVFTNNGDGTFTHATSDSTINDSNGMGSAHGDFDSDGDDDWFVSSIDGNRLYENVGGRFENRQGTVDVSDGGWGWGSCFADFNLDGHLDIYQTNGWFAENPAASEYSSDTTRLWMNNGEGRFTDMAAVSGVADDRQGRSVVCDDFDRDGDVDVLQLTFDPQRQQFLWINDLQNGNAISVKLAGVAPNTAGIGARIEVETDGRSQFRRVGINSSFTAVSSAEAIFGLGDADEATRISVTWPDGNVSMRVNVQAGSALTITHPDA